MFKIKHKVIKKHYTSKSCLVCGKENPFGVQAVFYEVEGGELCAVFTTKPEHQSYPGRLHGGLAAAILDELIGRSAMVFNPNAWSVTTRFQTRYLKPIPIGVELKALARLEKENRLLYEASGEIYLPDGTIAVSGKGTYMKMDPEKIGVDADFMENEFEIDINSPLPAEIQIGPEA